MAGAYNELNLGEPLRSISNTPPNLNISALRYNTPTPKGDKQASPLVEALITQLVPAFVDQPQAASKQQLSDSGSSSLGDSTKTNRLGSDTNNSKSSLLFLLIFLLLKN